MFRETPQSLRDRFWVAEQDRWRLQSAIRQMVRFARLNLAEPCYPAIANGTAALDLIVCRNVTAVLAAYRRMLYLDRHFVPGMVGMANIWRQLGRVADAQRVYRNTLQQLAALPTGAPVPGSEGATVGDMLALVRQQLAASI